MAGRDVAANQRDRPGDRTAKNFLKLGAQDPSLSPKLLRWDIALRAIGRNEE